MLYIFVPEIVLQRPGVVTVIRELIPATVPQHVRMRPKGYIGGLAEALDKPMELIGPPRSLTNT